MNVLSTRVQNFPQFLGENSIRIAKYLKLKTQNFLLLINLDRTLSNTIKGRGVSFMEDDNNWHYRIPTIDEVRKAKKELGIQK